MRVIVPPLTSQYLNLTKNSSLAVAIGYPDLVQIFAGTVLNQTGQAVEVVVITMGVYLTISLVTSLLMNLYNRRVALTDETMSDTATITDARLAFVRAKPFDPLPPPLVHSGAIGWLRENLFSSVLNILLTAFCVLMIAWLGPPLLKFLLSTRCGTARAGRIAS